jgi:hypothetical protein
MKKVNGIVFAQAQGNNKAVVADRYVAHALYEQNKEIIEKLGGEIVKGVGGFRAEFKSVANAKKFVAQAITEMSAKEYKASRKTKPVTEGTKKPKTSAKGSKKSDFITLTDAEGNEYKVPASALGQAKKPARKAKGDVAPTKSATKVKETKKPATKKGKGNAELTEAGKKALDRMKASVLNRAASAYSIANGGEATTFKALGKSAKDLSAYVPKAKEALLKSDKWIKASDTHGLTEDMLG